MLDINIHARDIRLTRFWPTNGNSFRIVFTPRFWSKGKPQDLDFWLEDAARAWDVYDALKDDRTELLITNGETEADLRQAALKLRQDQEAKAAAQADEPEAVEHDEMMPF